MATPNGDDRKSPRNSRPNSSNPAGPKPHRKGPRTDASRPSDGDSTEPRIKNRWRSEPPNVQAARESIRDAAAKAAGHPPAFLKKKPAPRFEDRADDYGDAPVRKVPRRPGDGQGTPKGNFPEPPHKGPRGVLKPSGAQAPFRDDRNGAASNKPYRDDRNGDAPKKAYRDDRPADAPKAKKADVPFIQDARPPAAEPPPRPAEAPVSRIVDSEPSFEAVAPVAEAPKKRVVVKVKKAATVAPEAAEASVAPIAVADDAAVTPVKAEIAADAPVKASKPAVVAEASTKPVKAAVVAPEPPAAPTGPTFDDLGLAENVRAAVAKAGYETPTPIQARSIPVLLSGRDLIGQAQTGTGKTAAFALPAIQLVDPSNWATQAIILAPTRELAIQVAEGIHGFASLAGVRVTAVYGGQPIDRQFRALKNGAHIVVGTPGRLLDHMRRETLSLAQVKLCVLDEADEMLALGFLEEVEAILQALPPVRQMALFSATFHDRVKALQAKYLQNPVTVKVESTRRTVDTTTQTYYDVVPGKKKEALAKVLDMEAPGPTIVFCRTRLETEELAEFLRVRGYGAEALHGDMGQLEREKVLRRFREGQADILVATDVAARGLDIDSVTHVVNYDIPWDVEQYIHRIGRTGRAGRTGDAITLVEPRQRRQLYFIEQTVGVKMKAARVPTQADIAARRRTRFVESLTEALNGGEFEAYHEIVNHLTETHSIEDVAAATVQLLWKAWSSSPEEIDADAAVDQERRETGMTRIYIGAGRFDGIRPGDIVSPISRELGLFGRDIGAIEIQDKVSFVEVPARESEAILEVLRNTRFKGRKVNVDYHRERR